MPRVRFDGIGVSTQAVHASFPRQMDLISELPPSQTMALSPEGRNSLLDNSAPLCASRLRRRHAHGWIQQVSTDRGEGCFRIFVRVHNFNPRAGGLQHFYR